MTTYNEATFIKDATCYRTIPIVRSYFVDTLTPIQVFQAFKEDAVYLLESNEEQSPWSNFSFIGLNPFITIEEDQKLGDELLRDEKEQAEHYMLLDLARNDLGRVSTYGSIKVPMIKELHFFSHVMHLVSKVTGKLREEVDPVEALLAAFPAGTVSGAPKVRAMQIIQELEPVARNIYAGTVAYIGFDGNIDSCIAIRTAVIKNQTAYVQAGAGIVADSVPELEWKETINKASAVIKAIQLAEKTFSERGASTVLKDYLRNCIEGKTLTEAEAEKTMSEIMNGLATPSQIASLLSVLRFRGETAQELIGFTRAMRNHMSPILLENNDDVIDTCGTGGDGVSTFNISTASAIVASAIGIKVAKHGNRAVSSKSGSADVLEYLGIPIQSSPEEAKYSLKNSSLSFLFAPIYHTAMKHAITPRKEIGFRTVFNLLGPLSNPARCLRQVIGVYDTRFAEKMAHTLKTLGSIHVLFVTGREGLDEISITTDTDVVELKDGEITRYTIHPKDFNLPIGVLNNIQTNSVEESAKLIEQVFSNCSNESARHTVLLNAGAAIYVSGKASSIPEGILLAKEALDSNKVFNHFQSLISKKEAHRYA